MAKKPNLPMKLEDVYFEPIFCKPYKGKAYLFRLIKREIETHQLGNCRFISCDENDQILCAFEFVSDAFIELIKRGYHVEFALKI